MVQDANLRLNTDPLIHNVSIFSMDAEALYPFLDIGHMKDGIRELIKDSEISFANIDLKHLTKFKSTRSLGHSAPLLLAPAEGSGALRAPRTLRALLGAFGPLFIAIKLYFES